MNEYEEIGEKNCGNDNVTSYEDGDTNLIMMNTNIFGILTSSVQHLGCRDANYNC